MKVSECMTRPALSCCAETNMGQAARLMWEHSCGVLPVVEGEDHVVGVVTDRDLCMGAYTRGRRLEELPVRNSMSREVFCCSPEASLEEALGTMGEHHVRRVPVTDDGGRLVGILSLDDISQRIASLDNARERARLSAQLVDALAAICRPWHAE